VVRHCSSALSLLSLLSLLQPEEILSHCRQLSRSEEARTDLEQE
jgi:hypothetical protein